MPIGATALSAAVLTILYWSAFALFDPAGTSWVTRSVFFAFCVAVLLFERRSVWSHASASVWAIRAAYCVLVAVLFYGANRARDILYGPERLKAEVPEWLGGLELWWVLCPGVFSVCLAIASARLLRR